MTAAADFHDYSLFGLKVRSAIPIPELISSQWSGRPDVSISQAALDPRGTQSGYNVIGEEILLDIPRVARFSITGGNSIRVDPVAGAPARNVRLYLLGSGIGALLHQRRLLPLHANAIAIDGKAIAFMGKSGAGKSTLAAWFHDEGYQVISDDICVVSAGDGIQPRVFPGIPRLRLWQDALEASGRRTDDFERSYVDDSPWNKFDVPVHSLDGANEPLDLLGLYLLDKGDVVEFSPLSGVEAAEFRVRQYLSGGRHRRAWRGT